MTIGERITARQEELVLKQYQVAEQIGVTKTTMSKYENNVNIPNADILARLALALQTSADYLCGKEKKSAPLGEKWVCTDFVDKSLIKIIRKLNHDNQLRLTERTEILLEQQNKTAEQAPTDLLYHIISDPWYTVSGLLHLHKRHFIVFCQQDIALDYTHAVLKGVDYRAVPRYAWI